MMTALAKPSSRKKPRLQAAAEAVMEAAEAAAEVAGVASDADGVVRIGEVAAGLRANRGDGEVAEWWSWRAWKRLAPSWFPHCPT